MLLCLPVFLVKRSLLKKKQWYFSFGEGVLLFVWDLIIWEQMFSHIWLSSLNRSVAHSNNPMQTNIPTININPWLHSKSIYFNATKTTTHYLVSNKSRAEQNAWKTVYLIVINPPAVSFEHSFHWDIQNNRFIITLSTLSTPRNFSTL